MFNIWPFLDAMIPKKNSGSVLGLTAVVQSPKPNSDQKVLNLPIGGVTGLTLGPKRYQSFVPLS